MTDTAVPVDSVPVRVHLPAHLRAIAQVDGEVTLSVAGECTQRSILDALEARYPALRGTMRDQSSKKRRAFVRFYACERDLSHDDPDGPVPAQVVSGEQPFLVIGAMAGG